MDFGPKSARGKLGRALDRRIPLGAGGHTRFADAGHGPTWALGDAGHVFGLAGAREPMP
jgi:hypothetical protein